VSGEITQNGVNGAPVDGEITTAIFNETDGRGCLSNIFSTRFTVDTHVPSNVWSAHVVFESGAFYLVIDNVTGVDLNGIGGLVRCTYAADAETVDGTLYANAVVGTIDPSASTVSFNNADGRNTLTRTSGSSLCPSPARFTGDYDLSDGSGNPLSVTQP
jgi:hypothetical protein